jgi:hypothetical protein
MASAPESFMDAGGSSRCGDPKIQVNGRWGQYADQFADQVDEHGRRLVVRNGYHQQRDVLTAAGAVAVKAPRVNDKRCDLGLQRRLQHPPSAVADDLIQQRPTRTSVVVGRLRIVNYREHGRTFPNQRANLCHHATFHATMAVAPRFVHKSVHNAARANCGAHAGKSSSRRDNLDQVRPSAMHVQ